MKINVNDVKFAPTHVDPRFQLCIFGLPNDKLVAWMKHWELESTYVQPYTNILIKDAMPIEDMFEGPTTLFEYVDGFSPNLNKHLHVGHMSNLVFAKAFQGLGIGKKFIAIFGDTLDGSVNKDHALDAYEHYCKQFRYKVHRGYFASTMKLHDFTALVSGEGDYATTKVFDVAGEKIVGIKSDGSTTYFYQDVALAQQLKASTLYLTGLEQDNHFKLLNKMYPQVSHIGLGLILLDGKKMSSSEGNVIYLQDILETLLPQFNNDYNLVYNVLAGNILKSEPKSVKNINSETLSNPALSSGMYISYTMARMKSAGINLVRDGFYISSELAIRSLKSKVNLNPLHLYTGIVEHCKKINSLYRTHQIKDNPENAQMFYSLTCDLVIGASELGLLPVEKV